MALQEKSNQTRLLESLSSDARDAYDQRNEALDLLEENLIENRKSNQQLGKIRLSIEQASSDILDSLDEVNFSIIDGLGDISFDIGEQTNELIKTRVEIIRALRKSQSIFV
jgi:hypothetical protein